MDIWFQKRPDIRSAWYPAKSDIQHQPNRDIWPDIRFQKIRISGRPDILQNMISSFGYPANPYYIQYTYIITIYLSIYLSFISISSYQTKAFRNKALFTCTNMLKKFHFMFMKSKDIGINRGTGDDDLTSTPPPHMHWYVYLQYILLMYIYMILL